MSILILTPEDIGLHESVVSIDNVDHQVIKSRMHKARVERLLEVNDNVVFATSTEFKVLKNRRYRNSRFAYPIRYLNHFVEYNVNME